MIASISSLYAIFSFIFVMYHITISRRASTAAKDFYVYPQLQPLWIVAGWIFWFLISIDSGNHKYGALVYFYLAIYGFSTFFMLSETFIYKLASILNRSREGRWIKEIEYIYLGIGFFVIIYSLTRTGSTTKIDRSSWFISSIDSLSPIIMTTAASIRALKTRAELEKWERLF